MSEPRDTTDESDPDQHHHPPAHPSSDSDDFLDEETEDDDFSPLAAPAAPAPALASASAASPPATVSPRAAAFTPPPAPPDLICDGVPREVPLSTEVLGVPDQDENDGETKLGGEGVENGVLPAEAEVKQEVKQEEGVGLGLELDETRPKSPNFLLLEGEDSGTEDDQIAFMKELERFHRERGLEYKPPKFYGEWLNCLKLWKKVARLGGYEQVTTCKLWRSVGESFRPPKTCTTVSWTFRIFYEKALLEYEKHKIRTGELQVPISSLSETMAADKKMGGNQPSGSGRARRDAAARAMEGWHSQRLLSNGDLGDPLIKGKNSGSLFKRDKYSKSSGGSHKRKTSSLDRAVQVPRTRYVNTHGDSMVMDVGEPADWVKINVRQTKDCYEVYALVPGLLREEVHVQSDACGRLVISGNPEQPDNPWGVTPFKKVITLPSQIDPHQTSAVVTLHGQLFVRAPFEQSD